jgi:dTDP-4-dehydrorhamnose reductase
MGAGEMTVRRKLALIGSGGMLASAVRRRAGAAWEIVGLDLPEFDLTDRILTDSVLGRLCPEVIVNCAAYTNVDGAETEESLAMRVNGEGPGHLAQIARQLGATLVHISTDYVFDGKKDTPYQEDDPVAPRSAYGRTKLAGEQAIIESGLERFFIVRTSWLYGPGGKNFVETIIRLAHERDELRIVADQVGSPTYTVDLAEAIFNLVGHKLNPQSLAPSPFGIYHFSNSGQCSWYEFAAEIVAQVKGKGESLKVKKVVPIRTEEYPLPAPRPAYSVFSKEKYRLATGAEIPEWRESLSRYLAERT